MDRQRDVKNWIRSGSFSVGALLETHVREENSARVIEAVVPGWRFDTNYIGSEVGRIWVVWDPTLLRCIVSRLR